METESRRKIFDLFEEQKEYIEKRVAEGIEQNRKGNAFLQITDKNGKPLENVQIKVNQKSHDFGFGANLFMLDELESEEKNAEYKKIFAETFNLATLPFYWDTLEPEKGKPRYAKDSPKIYRRPAIDLCIEFCEKHGIQPREHGLAYEQFFPKWLYGADTDTVKTELERRYKEISERYADKIPTIEVTNEMTWPKGRTEFYDNPEYLEWCYKTANKYFPNNKICVNEGTGLWGNRARAVDGYYAYTEATMLKGAKIDAIGMQYHLFYKKDNEYNATRETLNPKFVYKHLDLYANLKKPIQITEVTFPAFSNDAEDEAIQAELLEKLYSIWFSHENVEQIIYWNVIDGYAHLWDPSPEKIKASQGDMTLGENYYYGGLLRFDMTKKPAYYKLYDLIHKVWHTETSIKTDANGNADFRGFYGKYDVTVSVDGQEKTFEIHLSKNNDNKNSIKF